MRRAATVRRQLLWGHSTLAIVVAFCPLLYLSLAGTIALATKGATIERPKLDPAAASVTKPSPSPSARKPLFGITDFMVDDPSRIRYRGRPRIEDAYARGIHSWQVLVFWSSYEPTPGRYDRKYVRQIKRRIRDLLAAGYKVEVAILFAIDVVPSWAWRIPGANYKNQYGQEYNQSYPHYENYPHLYLNVAFNPQVRAAIARTIKRFFTDFRKLKKRFHAVYTSFSGEGDSIVPFVMDDPTNSFWAFDENAQNLQSPGSLAGPYPVPGWYPGKQDDRDPKKAQAFYDWYIESAVKTVEWQVEEFRKYYRGKIKLYSDIFWNHGNVTEGDVRAAVATNLDGSAPNEFWRLAAGYSTRYAETLARSSGLVPHHTACEWIDDAEVSFIRQYFSYLSCENAEWWDYPKPGYDGRGVLDASLANVRKYGIAEFKWLSDQELYRYRNPPVEYFERKIREFR